MFDPTVQRFLGGAAGGLVQRGSSLEQARLQSMRLLDASMYRQAAVLAYNHVFELITVLFLLSIPLIWFLKDKPPEGAIEIHVSE